MTSNRIRYVASVLCAAVLATVVWVSAGDLNPPAGAIAPTMKNLSAVEPRTPVQSLSGSATAVYVITQPGSYYLTGDINGQSGKMGIIVGADNVTLDLMGYSLIGGTGSWSGIAVVDAHSNLVIRNGTVRDWDGAGLWVINAGATHISDLFVTDNAQEGIYTSGGSVIDRCVVRQNGASGIYAWSGCVITNCTAVMNGYHGFAVTQDSVVSQCTSRLNEFNGFGVAGGTILKDCTATENKRDGISVGGSCIIVGNFSRNNGYTTGNGSGIYVDYGGSRIEGNNTIGNPVSGIKVIATGNVIIRNTSGYNTASDYNVIAGNCMGPIVTSATIGTNTSPHANYDIDS